MENFMAHGDHFRLGRLTFRMRAATYPCRCILRHQPVFRAAGGRVESAWSNGDGCEPDVPLWLALGQTRLAGAT